MYWGDKKVIAVGGEKNGIGKSTFVANLGVAMAKSGKRVIVVDADTGTTNLHTILGIKGTVKTLSDYLAAPQASLNDYLVKTDYAGLMLLGSARHDLALFTPTYSERNRLFHEIKQLDADVIIFDILAGSQQRATDFFTLAPIGVMLTEPKEASLEKSFTFLKNLLVRGLIRRFFHEKDMTELIKTTIGKNTTEDNVDFSELLVQLEAKAPAKVIAYRQLFMEGVCTMCLVANGVTDANQDAVIQDFAKNIEKHLGLHMPVIGSLPFEPDMKKVESTGEPFVSKFPQSKYTEEMNGIVETLAAIQTAKK